MLLTIIVYIYQNEDSRTESKSVIGELSELKYMLQTAKPIVRFSSKEPDTERWNSDIQRYEQQVDDELTFYNGPWLFVECYLYRRIREIFILRLKSLNNQIS